MDPWIVLKRQYLDERKAQMSVSSSTSSSSASNGSSGSKQLYQSLKLKLTGQEWYNQAASRAVNQVSRMKSTPSMLNYFNIDKYRLFALVSF